MSYPTRSRTPNRTGTGRLLPLLLAPAVAAALATTATATGAAAAPAAGGAPVPPGGDPVYVEQNLAVNGQGGFPNYRIPALTVTPGGDVLAAYCKQTGKLCASK